MDTNPPTPPTADTPFNADKATHINQRTRLELVKLVFEQSRKMVVIGVLTALLLVYVLRNEIDRNTLYIWFGCNITVAISRMVLVYLFNKQDEENIDAILWDRVYHASLFLITLVWGMAGWFLMSDTSPLYQAFTIFILIGMAGGSVGSYNSRFISVFIAVVMILLPLVFWLLFHQGEVYKAIAIAILLFTYSTIKASRQFEKRIIQSFQLGFELEEANQQVSYLANTDELTKLHNRRSFYTIAEKLFDAAKRYHQPLTLVELDIDKFKAINDQHGHAAGDKVLQALAGIIDSTIRASDVASRLGGDEFFILFPETGKDDIIPLIKRLDEACKIQLEHNGKRFGFSCSFGIAEMNPETESLQCLVESSDKMLYRAKAEGNTAI